MSELFEIEMLDKVLKWFATSSRGGRYHKMTANKEIMEMFPELNTREFEEWNSMIYGKLVKDGYLNSTEKDVGRSDSTAIYAIAFEGKLFAKSGGYAQQQRDANQIRENREIAAKVALRNERRLVLGTWGIAIGAIALVFWEMYKTFCLHL